MVPRHSACSPLAGYLDATARAFMETSSGAVCCTNRRALCYANFNARKNVMAIPHNAFKSEGEERDGVCVVRFVIYSCYSEFK